MKLKIKKYGTIKNESAQGFIFDGEGENIKGFEFSNNDKVINISVGIEFHSGEIIKYGGWTIDELKKELENHNGENK